MHWADVLYAKIVRKPVFFPGGCGPTSVLDSLITNFVNYTDPVGITVDWSAPTTFAAESIIAQIGRFSAVTTQPYQLPPSVRTAEMLCVRPRKSSGKRLCVWLAATSDEGYEQRLPLAKRLASHGVTTLLLENPFYGTRRVYPQPQSPVQTLVDQLLMNRASIDEARSLAFWAVNQGYTQVAIAGYSQGGQMAAYTAATLPFAVACAPLVAANSGTAVFVEGLLAQRVQWSRLKVTPKQLQNTCDSFAVDQFPVPKRPDACVIVGALGDGIVAAESTLQIHRHWRGSQLRWTHGGHVSTMVSHKNYLVRAVIDALDALHL